MDYYRENIPTQLAGQSLKINESKTEEYMINSRNDEWKRCRYLRSMLDSEADIKRRKQLAWMTYEKVKSALEDKTLNLTIKISIFRALISSVFLYNCEIWTTTKLMEQQIHRHQ